MMAFATTFLALMVGHVFADYVFQSAQMAEWKSPKASVPARAGKWWWWMLAHGTVNGTFVWMVTGSIGLGVLETVLHCIIDIEKCMGYFSAVEDQLGHIVCKALWALIAVKGGMP